MLSLGVDRAQQLAGKGIEVVGNLSGRGPSPDSSDIVAQQEKDIAVAATLRPTLAHRRHLQGWRYLPLSAGSERRQQRTQPVVSLSLALALLH